MEESFQPTPNGASPRGAGARNLRVLLGVNRRELAEGGFGDLVRVLRKAGVTVGVACFSEPFYCSGAPEALETGLTLQCDQVFLPPPGMPCAAPDPLSDWVLNVAAGFAPHVVHLADARHANLPWGAPVLVEADPCLGGGKAWGNQAAACDPADRRQVAAGLVAADLVVASTRSGLEELSRSYGPFEATFLIPNGFSPRGRRSRRKSCTIFSVTEDSETDLWDRIAPHLDWRVSVAAGLESAMPESLGGCVERLGALSEAAFHARLDSAAIYASPSRRPPGGDAILEAASRGCALVLGDLPALREHWEGAAVFLPTNEMEAWCGLLQLLIHDENARRELGFRARVRARRFSARARAKRWIGAYEALRSKGR